MNILHERFRTTEVEIDFEKWCPVAKQLGGNEACIVAIAVFDVAGQRSTVNDFGDHIWTDINKVAKLIRKRLHLAVASCLDEIHRCVYFSVDDRFGHR